MPKQFFNKICRKLNLNNHKVDKESSRGHIVKSAHIAKQLRNWGVCLNV